MATAAAREEQLGAGGKFRKTPFRRTTHTTPYDRPPAATANGGWISKLVDPAQKLLTYSAHRLFSTVFHKRLPPPPPTPPSSEANHEARVMDKGEVDMGPPGVQNDANKMSTDLSVTSAGDGFPLIEQFLEQKTFTRPEIDRLKELLHSRTDDIPIENLEKRSEVIPSMSMISYDRKEEYAKTFWQEKSDSRLISTPVVKTTVPDEDAASPVELAKAYMSTKLSPSMLGLRNQADYEDSHISNTVAFSSKSPIMSVVSRFSSNEAAPDIGFTTPRSRGRSAIHSMARTPYSRVRMHSTFKGPGPTFETHGAPSSSTQAIWEHSQPSGSKQGALKRRFSVLDSDIGSLGPIRRIRPKPSLISSRGLSSPMSIGASRNPTSSTKRHHPLGENNHTLAKASSENGDNAIPRTFTSTVPSQSSKAASKIFEHLDKIASPKEKSPGSKLLSMSDGSPTKLSPSMLHGQALKSLEKVDASKFLENPRYKNKNMDVSSNQLTPDASFQKVDHVKENCPSRILALCDNSRTEANEVVSSTEKEDVIKVKPAVSAASNTIHPSEKKQPFKMSAHEYLELDDDDYSINGYVPGSFGDGKVQVEKIAAANLERPVASTEVKPPSSFALNEKPDGEMSDGLHTVEAGARDTIPKPVPMDKADKNNSEAEVSFRVPEPAVSSSSAAATAPTIFSTTSQVSNNIASQSSLSSMALAANTNSATAVTSSGSNLFTSISAPSFSAEPFFKFPISTAVTGTQALENSSLLGDKNQQDGDFANISRTVIPGTCVTSAGAGNALTVESAATSFPAATIQSGPTFSSGHGSRFDVQASPGLSFKSETSEASTALTSGGTSSLEFLNDKTNQGGSFGTVSSNLFSGMSATSASASSNSFGFSAAASTPTVTSQAPGSATGTGPGTVSSNLFSGTLATSASASSSSFGFSAAASTPTFTSQAPGSATGTGPGTHMSPGGTGVASFTQSAPVQLGSSSSSSVFSFVGNTAFSSGGSSLGSSTPSSLVNPSSSSTAPSTVFGSGWQPATSSKFASAVNSTSSSPAFQFGASSVSAATNTSAISFGTSSSFAATSNSAATVFGMPSGSAPAPASNSLPTLFGASTVSAPTTNSASGFGMSNGASSTGAFPFTSFTTASQSAFGNSNSMGFPTALSGNNDQMSVEDSMAEDTVHASQPTVATFSQQSVSATPSTAFQFSQQPVSTPQTSFVFGGSTNGFSFQSQPNQSNSQNPSPFQPVNGLANSQNPSPFQGSNSLGLTTNSFSLGAADKSNRKFVKVNRSKNRKK